MHWLTGSSVSLVSVILTVACASGQASTRWEGTRAGPGKPPTQTGAVTSLASAEVQGGDPQSIIDYLRGRVPGLDIREDRNGEIMIRLRGGNVSLLSGRESVSPLVIIDGIPVAQEQLTEVLRLINPKDIIRVDVLRDLASTSSYGIRGAGGVILIRLRHR